MLDYGHIEGLEELYRNLEEIRKILSDALEEDALATIEFYSACAELKLSDKMSEKSRLIELCKAGKKQIVERYVNAEKDVSKAKAGFKVAEHAINVKKHIGNIEGKHA